MSLAETVINSFLDRKLAQPATPALYRHPDDRSLTRGLLAGVVAGVAATAAKSLVEKVYPPTEPVHPEPHWAFGAATGAAYGALAEFYPVAASRDGVNFGMTLMALTHESGVPALGVEAAPIHQSTRSRTSEIAGFIVFGLVAETTRRLVRRML